MVVTKILELEIKRTAPDLTKNDYHKPTAQIALNGKT